MHLALIVPAPFDAVSGGYAYDRRIVAGLREAGHTVEVVELPGAHPLADAVARNAARAALDDLPDACVRSSTAWRCLPSPAWKTH